MKRLWSALGVLAFGVLTMGGMIVLSPIPASAAAPPPQAAPTQAQEEGPPPVPEAKLQEEFAAYQQFMQEQGPDEQIRMVEDFLLEYPQSELKEYAFQVATQAYQAKNDYARVLTYGELTLSENENNLTALLILASAIAERTSRRDIDYQEKLADAEGYAGRALQQISNLRKPSNFTIAQWVATKKDAEATPRAALGLIALIRENFARAEAEFKMATTLFSRPDPVTWYRLGLAYSYQEKYDLALEALERSATAGGVRVPSPGGGTRDLVSEAKEFALKSKAVSRVPVSGSVLFQSPVSQEERSGDSGAGSL
ncbi:MAG: hypothetical protein IH935_11860 [Acidobacteria bacterium]|nr:hypothetical protein [Acidobacteriota bacterium]